MATPPRIAVLQVRAPLERSDLPGLIARTCALLGDAPIDVLSCAVEGVSADGVAVDALAQLALAARRRGCRTQLSGASQELIALVSFVGLGEVLHCRPA